MLPHRAPRCLARVMAVASAVLRQCMRSARVSDACALHSRFRYSHGNRTRWICCSPDREIMENEFGFYQKLVRRGQLKLVLGQPRRGHGRR